MNVDALWDSLEALLAPMFRDFRSRVHSLEVETKVDNTLLTEADIAVQEALIAAIRQVDPAGTIVAEELMQSDEAQAGFDGRVWIIDPIDGTAEFVDSTKREFCSVVCLLEARRPVAAFVYAPEIGPSSTPVCVKHVGAEDIYVNGVSVGRDAPRQPQQMSLTRSATAPARPFETIMDGQGFELKTRTTSQTLDMVRACVDLTRVTDPALASFALFYREQQKVWDGAAGMSLAQAVGLRVTDRGGAPRAVIDIDLSVPEPTFASTLVGSGAAVDAFLAAVSLGSSV